MNASIAESLIQRGEETYNSIQWFRDRLEVGDVLLVLTNSGNNIGMKEDLRIEDPMLFEVKNIPPVAWAIAHMNPVVAILIDELVKWKFET